MVIYFMRHTAVDVPQGVLLRTDGCTLKADF